MENVEVFHTRRSDVAPLLKLCDSQILCACVFTHSSKKQITQYMDLDVERTSNVNKRKAHDEDEEEGTKQETKKLKAASDEKDTSTKKAETISDLEETLANGDLTGGTTLLHLASASGKLELVQQVLAEMEKIAAEREELNVKDKDGKTALHVAATDGHVAVVRFLVGKGAKTEEKTNKSGYTPLHLAVLNGHLEVVKTLLELGAQVEEKAKNSSTALYLAVRVGEKEIVECLLERGANVEERDESDSSMLTRAVLSGETELVKLLVKWGATLTRTLYHADDIVSDTGFSVLHMAAAVGHAETVGALLDLGMDINSVALEQHTPLHWATIGGQVPTVKLLIERNADLDVTDREGLTPLHWAALNGKKEVVKILCEAGADIHAEDIIGCTPLHRAVIPVRGLVEMGGIGGEREEDECEMVRFLVDEMGMDVNERSGKGGCTPLHIACTMGSDAMLRTLVDVGAELDVIDDEGQTALHLAAGKDLSDKLRILAELDADLDATNEQGDTALHIAARMGHIACVNTLVASGASVRVRNETEMLAQHCAAISGHAHCVRALCSQPGAFVDEKGGKDGYTMLHYAALLKRDEVVWMILNDLGGSVNVRGDNKNTPLLLTAFAGKSEMCRKLVERGADLHAVDKDGCTVVHKAAKSGCVETVKTLIELGASTKVEKNIVTPLHTAAACGHLEMVEYLVGLGYDMKHEDAKKNLALHFAAQMGHPSVVEWLVKAGANIEAKNQYGSTPLNAAASSDCENLGVVKVLCELGAEIDAPNVEGCTPLFLAAEDGNDAIVEYLAEKGANVKAKDHAGATPLAIASNNGHADAVKVLLRFGAGSDVVSPSSTVPSAAEGSEVASPSDPSPSSSSSSSSISSSSSGSSPSSSSGATPFYSSYLASSIPTVAKFPPVFSNAENKDCTICCEKCTFPIEYNCGHTFCWACVVGLQGSGVRKCPNCRQPIKLIVF